MLKIFFSIDLIKKRLKHGIREDSGWGHLSALIKNALRCDYQFVDEPHDADIELFVGQPTVMRQPLMTPNLIYSMYEKYVLPPYWVDAYKKWDVILNPSRWGVDSYTHYGINTISLPPPVDFNRFKYQKRNIDKWTYYCGVRELYDRKGAIDLVPLFMDKMPPDATLVVKTNPADWYTPFDMWVAPNVHVIQLRLSWDEYLKTLYSAQVSINPSTGEGIGQIPLECMATGMCTILTDYSGMHEFVECGLPISYSKLVNAPMMEHFDIEIDTEQLLSHMLWTYENRERSLAIGELAAQYVRYKFSKEKFRTKFNEIVETIDLSKRKQLRYWHEDDPLEDWMHRGLLRKLKMLSDRQA